MLRNRTLFFGDNLKVLREKFSESRGGDAADGLFELIYLDPPFNSNRNYNVLFKEGVEDSAAQIHAFEDTWHWNAETQALYDSLVRDPSYPQKVSDLMQGLEKLIGKNDMMAYLVMMTVRLIELHRVLKETGSLYLHCDPTASHYLKIVLDSIFQPRHFRSEIIWKRSAAHGGSSSYNNIHDIILFYSKGDSPVWNSPRAPHDESYIKSHYSNMDTDGKRYQLVSAHGAGDGPSRRFGERIIPPPPGRHWMSQEHIDQMMAQGKVVFTKSGMPRYKRYLDETDGTPLGTVWDDISPINSQAKERLGYPTQKPSALLERILLASTNEGDWVLDPFGGCGTTAVAAEKLKRNWCIIDVTPLAINLVKRRIEDMYPEAAPEMTVDGYPADVAGAVALFQRNPFDFEYWACDLINARPAGDKSKGKMKGADRGIDGVITFADGEMGTSVTDYRKILVQVKGGHVSSRDIRDFRGTIEREKAAGGIFLTLEESSKPMRQDAVEAGSYTFNLTGQKYPVIQILTVAELMEGKRPEHPSAMGYAKKAEKAKEDVRQPLF